MSTFIRKTKHPKTGEEKMALWIDDYYGCHLYGVGFNKDGSDVEISNFNIKKMDIFNLDNNK